MFTAGYSHALGSRAALEAYGLSKEAGIFFNRRLARKRGMAIRRQEHLDKVKNLQGADALAYYRDINTIPFAIDRAKYEANKAVNAVAQPVNAAVQPLKVPAYNAAGKALQFAHSPLGKSVLDLIF